MIRLWRGVREAKSPSGQGSQAGGASLSQQSARSHAEGHQPPPKRQQGQPLGRAGAAGRRCPPCVCARPFSDRRSPGGRRGRCQLPRRVQSHAAAPRSGRRQLRGRRGVPARAQGRCEPRRHGGLGWPALEVLAALHSPSAQGGLTPLHYAALYNKQKVVGIAHARRCSGTGADAAIVRSAPSSYSRGWTRRRSTPSRSRVRAPPRASAAPRAPARAHRARLQARPRCTWPRRRTLPSSARWAARARVAMAARLRRSRLQMLIQRGINPEAKNTSGLTAFDVAKQVRTARGGGGGGA
jgi:hypothetical protein